MNLFVVDIIFRRFSYHDIFLSFYNTMYYTYIYCSCCAGDHVTGVEENSLGRCY